MSILRALHLFKLLFFLLTLPMAVFAIDSPVEVKLIPGVKAAAVDNQFQVGVQFTMKPGWHIYGKAPGEVGLPTKVSLVSPAGVQVAETIYPADQKFMSGESESFGYAGQTMLTLPVTISAEFKDHSEVELSFLIKWLACDGSLCVPGKASPRARIEIASEPIPDNEQLFASSLSKVGTTTQVH